MDPGKGIKFLVIGALTIVFLLQIYKSYANWMNPEVARIFSEELIGTDTPHPDLSICLFNLTTNETEEYLKSRTPVQIFEELPPIYSVVPYYKPQGLK